MGGTRTRRTPRKRHTHHPPGPGPTAPLTPQEREIAALAAPGLTKKQIGERLYPCPRTVSTHPYNAFPKVGISSRAALHDTLAEQPPASD